MNEYVVAVLMSIPSRQPPDRGHITTTSSSRGRRRQQKAYNNGLGRPKITRTRPSNWPQIQSSPVLFRRQQHHQHQQPTSPPHPALFSSADSILLDNAIKPVLARATLNGFLTPSALAVIQLRRPMRLVFHSSGV